MDTSDNGTTTPRAPSHRSKRSRTNLSNLRLAPLSSQYSAPTHTNATIQSPRSPYDEALDAEFTRNHSSYLQGKSAPTTPGILSRSSSRRHLHAGLSRRSSIYDEEVEQQPALRFQYSSGGMGRDFGKERERVAVGSGKIPKAKSEAALLVQRSKLAGQGVQLSRQQSRQSGRGTGGSTTPRAKASRKTVEDDWLTRTGAAANAMLQESKGQSWLATRSSSTALSSHLQDTTDEEDDEGYEEMAALSANAARQQQRQREDELSPTSTRASRWGSRYGSRRTSRRGSMTGSRTPLAQTDAVPAFFDEDPLAVPTEADFVDPEDENAKQEDETLVRLAENGSFGLGSIVDRLMNFSLFKVEEREEATEDESEGGKETEAEAKQRMAAEKERKTREKEKLVRVAKAGEGGEGTTEQGEGGWADAAWLLSVASKAMF